MKAKIYDSKTMKYIGSEDVASYQLILEDAEGSGGQITVARNLPYDAAFCILELEGFEGKQWVISNADTSDAESTTLRLLESFRALDTYVALDLISTETSDPDWNHPIRTVLKCVLTDYSGSGKYNQAYNPSAPTSLIGLPYSEYSSALNTAADAVPLASADDIFDYNYTYDQYQKAVLVRLGHFIRYIKRNGIGVYGKIISSSGAARFKVSRMITFSQTPKNILFDDGHTFLESETYDYSVVSSVLVLCSDYAGYPYLLKKDGSIARRRVISGGGGEVFDTSNAINGEHKTVKTSVANYTGSDETKRERLFTTLQPYAQEVFDENKYSHKIVFRSDKEYKFGDAVNLVLKHGNVLSRISSVGKNSDDSRYIYTCGELPMTASEKINAFGWKYGSRLPNNPQKGTLFIKA